MAEPTPVLEPLEALKVAVEWLDWWFSPTPTYRTGPTRDELLATLRAAVDKPRPSTDTGGEG